MNASSQNGQSALRIVPSLNNYQTTVGGAHPTNCQQAHQQNGPNTIVQSVPTSSYNTFRSKDNAQAASSSGLDRRQSGKQQSSYVTCKNNTLTQKTFHPRQGGAYLKDHFNENHHDLQNHSLRTQNKMGGTNN
jgi:hypothetical protein